MKSEFNHAANDSPRSGSSRKSVRVVLGGILLVIIAVMLWLGLHA